MKDSENVDSAAIEHWDDYPTEIQAVMGVFALHWLLDQRLGHVDAETQFGRTECQLLVLLVRPRRMGDLARIALKTPSAVTSAAANLEEFGQISRVRDASDGRAWLLQLTPEGRRTREKLVLEAADVFYQTTGLVPEEAEVLAGLARKIQQKAIQIDLEEQCSGEKK